MSTGKREQFGTTEVLFLSNSDEMTITGTTDSDQLVFTGSRSVSDVKKAIADICSGFAAELNKIAKDIAPDEIELGMSLGFSESANFWMIGVAGDQRIDLKLKWKK